MYEPQDPKEIAEFARAMHVVRRAEAMGGAVGRVVEIARAYLDVREEEQYMRGENPAPSAARILLSTHIPDYKRLVPKEVQELLEIDIEALERKCAETVARCSAS